MKYLWDRRTHFLSAFLKVLVARLLGVEARGRLRAEHLATVGALERLGLGTGGN